MFYCICRIHIITTKVSLPFSLFPLPCTSERRSYVNEEKGLKTVSFGREFRPPAKLRPKSLTL